MSLVQRAAPPGPQALMTPRLYARWGASVKRLAPLLLLLLLVRAAPAADRFDPARNREALLARLTAAFEAGEVDRVLSVFADSLGNDAELTPRLWNLKGLALAARGRHGEAVAAYERGMRGGMHLYELHMNLGRSLQALGVTGRALAEYRQAVERAPGAVDARLALGEGYLDYGRYAQARTELEEAARLDPDDLRVLRQRARLADETGNAAESLALWAQLEEREPGPDTARRLGELRAGEDPALAAGWYEACASRDSAALDCAAAAGTLLLGLGRPEEARPWLERACTADEPTAATVQNLLLLYQQQGSLEALEALVRRHPPSTGPGWGAVALARRAAGRSRAALEAARRAVEASPENLDLANILAVLLHENGHPEEARRRWKWILERDPAHPQARRNLSEQH